MISEFNTTLNFRRIVLVDEEDPQLFPLKLGGNDDFLFEPIQHFFKFTVVSDLEVISLNPNFTIYSLSILINILYIELHLLRKSLNLQRRESVRIFIK
jgi:hypothetical protein